VKIAYRDIWEVGEITSNKKKNLCGNGDFLLFCRDDCPALGGRTSDHTPPLAGLPEIVRNKMNARNKTDYHFHMP
jgi:hypothetical protein